MEKRGQITLYIIIGIVLVILAFVFTGLTRRSEISEDYKINFQDDVTSFEMYLNQCLRNQFRGVLYRLGYQSGYINPVEIIITFDHMSHSVPRLINQSHFKSLEEINNEASSVILDAFAINCFNFSLFEEKGYEIIPETDPSKISATMQFNERDTKVYVEYPIKFSYARNQKIPSQFVASFPVRFLKSHNVTNKTLNEIFNGNQQDINISSFNFCDSEIRNDEHMALICNVFVEDSELCSPESSCYLPCSYDLKNLTDSIRVIRIMDYYGYNQTLRTFEFKFGLHNISIFGSCTS